MTIGGNTRFIYLIIFNAIADQLINIPLQVFYDDMGAKNTFKVWWFATFSSSSRSTFWAH